MTHSTALLKRTLSFGHSNKKAAREDRDRLVREAAVKTQTLRFALIGDSGVGKTSLATQWMVSVIR